MSSSVKELQAKLYPRPEQRDPIAVFLATLDQHLHAGNSVLDIGAGAGERNPYSIKGRVAQLWGVDVDPRVVHNPLIDRGIISDGETLPVADETIDVAFSIYVQEHIKNARSFAQEVFRVLRPGGIYLALTPNKFHYVPLIAGLTPTSFHRWLNARRGREEADTFPTFYRLNTASACRRHFTRAGFAPPEIRSIEVEPQYLKFSRPSYMLGVAYERLVNASEIFAPFRVNLVISCRKPVR